MVFMQDQAITESMGPITDHGFEHLVASDQMVARTRRRVLKSALPLRQEGSVPPGVHDPEVMWEARRGSFHTAAGADWQQAYREHLARATRIPRAELASEADPAPA